MGAASEERHKVAGAARLTPYSIRSSRIARFAPQRLKGASTTGRATTLTDRSTPGLRSRR
jgi:hypothetical protein